MTTQEFVDVYRELFSLGDLNQINYREAAYFLKGMKVMLPEIYEKEDALFEFDRIINILMGAANLVEQLLLNNRS